VYRSVRPIGPYSKIGTVPAGWSPAYSDTGLPAGATFYYVVTAVEDGQWGSSVCAQRLLFQFRIAEAEELCYFWVNGAYSNMNDALDQHH
jgi:hypothetical protein